MSYLPWRNFKWFLRLILFFIVSFFPLSFSSAFKWSSFSTIFFEVSTVLSVGFFFFSSSLLSKSRQTVQKENNLIVQSTEIDKFIDASLTWNFWDFNWIQMLNAVQLPSIQIDKLSSQHSFTHNFDFPLLFLVQIWYFWLGFNYNFNSFTISELSDCFLLCCWLNRKNNWYDNKLVTSVNVYLAHLSVSFFQFH